MTTKTSITLIGIVCVLMGVVNIMQASSIKKNRQRIDELEWRLNRTDSHVLYLIDKSFK